MPHVEFDTGFQVELLRNKWTVSATHASKKYGACDATISASGDWTVSAPTTLREGKAGGPIAAAIECERLLHRLRLVPVA